MYGAGKAMLVSLNESLAGVVAFLLSSDADWLTGQTIVLDGGATLTGGG